ncbi:WXG100 family type VII secretion target [Kitasatospora sp. NPDC086009]|uniref:WXG100 family type VII secretion target n=1 Tax=unclassified Kitasatospora TaxID=2633591 RepID=UPI0037C707ED
MSDRATAFDRMMNPWAYDADGNLTTAARQQEGARTRINSANAPGDGGTVGVDPAALDSAANSSDQIHGRLNGDGRAADDETAQVATSLANWSTGKAAAQTAATWDQQIAALNSTIGELTQALRDSATNYRNNETAVKHDMKG